MPPPPPEPQIWIKITSPVNGATISGNSPAVNIPITGTVTTSGGALIHDQKVWVQLGAEARQLATGVATWSYSGSVQKPGQLMITATVEGRVGIDEISAEDWVQVIVDITDVTLPDLTISAPLDGATVYGDGKITQVPVSVSAADTLSGISGISWSLDGIVKVTEAFVSDPSLTT